MESNHISQAEELPWLDKTYLEKILNTNENEPVTVRNFSKKLATEKGENFASVIHILNAEYTINRSNKSKNVSLITKTKTCEEYIAEVIENLNVFERESHIYIILLKDFENMLKDIGIRARFGPRCIYVDEGIIVMENLKEIGYSLQDIKKGLNYQQCEALLKKLAQFHACSMLLYQKDTNLFKYNITPTITEEDENPMHIFYKNQFETCIELCKIKPELQKFVSHLEERNKNLIARIANIFKKSKNCINVLNHGDAWSNNFLFKINPDDDAVEDVLMIDYQETIFGSPAIDLLCFMYSSWSKETYSEHKDTLIQYYVKILEKTLKSLKYSDKIPTIEEIYQEIEIKKDHGIVTVVCLLPVYLNEHPELSDPANFIMDTEEAKEIRFKLMNNEKFFDKLNLFLSNLLEI